MERLILNDEPWAKIEPLLSGKASDGMIASVFHAISGTLFPRIPNTT